MTSLLRTDTTLLRDIPLGKYSNLPLASDKIIATYIWIDGTDEMLRSKDRTLNYITEVPKDKLNEILDEMNEEVVMNVESGLQWNYAHHSLPPYFCPKDLEGLYSVQCKLRDKPNKDRFDENLKDLPIWSFDGSSTGQANIANADYFLVPRAIYRDPFRRGNHILVICDTYDENMEPTESNHRVKCQDAHNKSEVDEPWFGMIQEYVVLGPDNRPGGWPPGGFPRKDGPYYCGVGGNTVFGRDIVEAHFRCCIYAGVSVKGTVAHVMPSQWEYQVGPSFGIDVADDLWVSRYILHRLTEEYGLTVSFDPKPVPHWKGCGVMTNISTKKTRDENGIVDIEKAIEKLALAHMRHIKVYDPHGGKDNERRLLSGEDAVDRIEEFHAGVANQGKSIRIRRLVVERKKGYFEDRRPAANCDPYLVIDALLRTCVMNE